MDNLGTKFHTPNNNYSNNNDPPIGSMSFQRAQKTLSFQGPTPSTALPRCNWVFRQNRVIMPIICVNLYMLAVVSEDEYTIFLKWNLILFVWLFLTKDFFIGSPFPQSGIFRRFSPRMYL